MDAFIDSTCKKINYKLYMLGKIRQLITTHAAVIIYKQPILPHFDYGGFRIDSASVKSLSKLDKYQKRAIHLIEYKPKYTRAKKMLQHRIQNIRKRRKEQLLAFMYM